MSCRFSRATSLPPCPTRGTHLVVLGLGALLLCCFCPALPTLALPRSIPAQEAEHPPFPVRGMQRPGYLGVSLRDLDAAESSRLQTMGVMIVTVDRDAPAWTAGLRPGDIMTEMNGQPVEGVEILRRRLREYPAGTSITLRVHRGGAEVSYTVILRDQEAVAQNAWSQHVRVGAGTELAPAQGFAASPATPPPPPNAPHGMASTLFDALIPGAVYTGMEVGALTPQLASFFGVPAGGGLLVTDVRGGSPAATAGLAAGDVIVRASNQPIATRSGLARTLRNAKGNAIPLAVLRDHKEVVLSLQPGKRKRL